MNNCAKKTNGIIREITKKTIKCIKLSISVAVMMGMKTICT